MNRIIIGFLIPAVGVVATLTNKSTSGFKFAASNWLIPIVLFGFLIVVILDNIILALAYFTDRHRKRSSRWSEPAYERTRGTEDDDTAKLVSSSTYEMRKSGMDDSASTFSRHTSYQPYDADAARTELAAGRDSPLADRHSRTSSPQPSPQIPVSMILQGNFRPSHARTRSAGYAVVNVDEYDDYIDGGQIEAGGLRSLA